MSGKKNLILLLLAFATQIALAHVQETEINSVVNGVRQGFWRLEGKNGKVDEGYYVDGKKDGKWKGLSANGAVMSIITYNAGKPQGEAIFYDENGKETEHGYWNIDHWEGNYVRYHANGNKACEFIYDGKGRRNGPQKYFHENGKVMYDGNWENGKIKGVLTAYDDQGRKVLERNYNDEGKFVSAVETPITQGGTKGNAELRKFTGTGAYTLFNINGKIDRKGNFVKGELIDGERYVYDEDGNLSYIEIYADGKVKGKK